MIKIFMKNFHHFNKSFYFFNVHTDFKFFFLLIDFFVEVKKRAKFKQILNRNLIFIKFWEFL